MIDRRTGGDRLITIVVSTDSARFEVDRTVRNVFVSVMLVYTVNCTGSVYLRCTETVLAVNGPWGPEVWAWAFAKKCYTNPRTHWVSGCVGPCTWVMTYEALCWTAPVRSEYFWPVLGSF